MSAMEYLQAVLATAMNNLGVTPWYVWVAMGLGFGVAAVSLIYAEAIDDFARTHRRVEQWFPRLMLLPPVMLIVALLLSGCASGFPGSPTRAFYNLCLVEGQPVEYCEAWAAVEAMKLTAGQVSTSFVIPFPPVGR